MFDRSNFDFDAFTVIEGGQTKATNAGKMFANKMTFEYITYQNDFTGETIILEFAGHEFNTWKMYSSMKGRDENKFRKNVGVIKAWERDGIPISDDTATMLMDYLPDVGFSEI